VTQSSLSDAPPPIELAPLWREVLIARETQARLAPVSPQDLPGLRLEHHILPAATLSGDFVDYMALADGAVLFCLGDVSGHGMHAALFTPLMKVVFRGLGHETFAIDLDAALARFDEALRRTGTRCHAAVCLGVLAADRAQLRLVGAAQFPPPFLQVGGTCRTIELVGKPLGLFQGAHYAEAPVDLAPGARLVVFSDGVLDGRRGDDEVRIEELSRRLAVVTGGCADLLSASGVEPGAVRNDDVACLLIECTATP
jgi:serine phosphatase RsbU (regulator of sigma subunit)